MVTKASGTAGPHNDFRAGRERWGLWSVLVARGPSPVRLPIGGRRVVTRINGNPVSYSVTCAGESAPDPDDSAAIHARAPRLMPAFHQAPHVAIVGARTSLHRRDIIAES